MYKRLIPLFVLLGIGILCYSQQPMQVSQYMFNKYQLNPAYAGLDYSLSITGLYRSQWNEFANAPLSQNINAHLPMYILNGGIGVNVANEQIGYFNNTMGTVSYNYVYESFFGLLSFGAKAGFIQSRLNNAALKTPDGNYEGLVINHNDPILTSLPQSGVGVLYGAGVYIVGNFGEGGISIAQTPSNNISLDGTKVALMPLMNVYAQTDIEINDQISISPVLLVKTDFVEVQTDISAIVKLSGNIFGGIGVRGYSPRTLDAATLLAGWRFNEHYTLSYAYDIGLSALRSAHAGTHEILLNYNLNKLIGAGLPPKIIYNPRYL